MFNKIAICATVIVLSNCFCFGQIEVRDSKISTVSLYKSGAEITRTFQVELEKGENNIEIKNISSKLISNSLRVKSPNALIRQIQYVINNEKKSKIDFKMDSLKVIQSKINLLKVEKGTLNEHLNYLKLLKSDPTNKLMSELLKESREYKNEIANVKREVYQVKQKIDALEEKRNGLTTLQRSKDIRSAVRKGQVNLLVNAKQKKRITFSLIARVKEASWSPRYDLEIDKNGNAAVSWYAHVSQNTGVDWGNVDLKLRNEENQTNDELLVLSTRYLKASERTIKNFLYEKNVITVDAVKMLTENRVVNSLRGQVAGAVVTQSSGGVGASSRVIMKGFTSITGNNQPLYVVDGIPFEMSVSTSGQNESRNAVDYGSSISDINPDDVESVSVLKGAAAAAMYGSRAQNGVVIIRTKKASSTIWNAELKEVVNPLVELDLDWKLKGKISIKSSNKSQDLFYKNSEMNVEFDYKTVPRLTRKAFVVAKLNGYRKQNLLEGKMSVYFDGEYLGKGEWESDHFADTMKLALGWEGAIQVNRTIEDKKVVKGKRTKEMKTVFLSFTNNKNSFTSLEVMDQIPLSKFKDVKIKMEEMSNVDYNPDTGIMKWKLKLKKGEIKVIKYQYSIDFPSSF